MAMSNLGLLVSLGALGVYGYSCYYLSQPKMKKGFEEVFPNQLHTYGLLRFLTIQCLIIQLINSALHVIAHFVKQLRGLRDLVFTTLALPVGSMVVYSFWFVWFVYGRELIFPIQMDKFHPQWLNHCTHTIIVPINLLLAVLVNHRYIKNGVLVTLVYMLCYTIFLYVVKAQTGFFIYGYLDELNDTVRAVYFAATAVFSYLMYKSGAKITNLTHGGGQVATKKPMSKGQKQK